MKSSKIEVDILSNTDNNNNDKNNNNNKNEKWLCIKKINKSSHIYCSPHFLFGEKNAS